jgi:hypothetical protein
MTKFSIGIVTFCVLLLLLEVSMMSCICRSEKETTSYCWL